MKTTIVIDKELIVQIREFRLPKHNNMNDVIKYMINELHRLGWVIPAYKENKNE